jgi:hypothetical protein
MTDPPEIEKIVCHHCSAVLDVGDNFCRHCGAPLGDEQQSSAAPRGGVYPRMRYPPTAGAQSDRSDHPAKWSESRWMVLAALFALLGPLALPMLWRSPRFPTVWKIILTVLLVAVTVLVVWILWYVFHKLLEPLRNLGELQGL